MFCTARQAPSASSSPPALLAPPEPVLDLKGVELDRAEGETFQSPSNKLLASSPPLPNPCAAAAPAPQEFALKRRYISCDELFGCGVSAVSRLFAAERVPGGSKKRGFSNCETRTGTGPSTKDLEALQLALNATPSNSTEKRGLKTAIKERSSANKSCTSRRAPKAAAKPVTSAKSKEARSFKAGAEKAPKAKTAEEEAARLRKNFASRRYHKALMRVVFSSHVAL